ncbi:hypothetical protein NE237_016408 [Protea cynaroides]|uniref:Uncharacterized protein n=1 Tax=Protea cynaroides TaxID=273540 RepID=A0A9Q0HER4_9MAGN|nr:hypothetical protein NE237_016408 [Protea cynaroides]
MWMVVPSLTPSGARRDFIQGPPFLFLVGLWRLLESQCKVCGSIVWDSIGHNDLQCLWGECDSSFVVVASGARASHSLEVPSMTMESLELPLLNLMHGLYLIVIGKLILWRIHLLKGRPSHFENLCTTLPSRFDVRSRGIISDRPRYCFT